MAAFGATITRAGRRLLSSFPALFGVLVFTFLLMRVLPGDPAVFFASGPNAGKEEIEVIRKQMGLNKPVPEQLMLYLYDVGRGNLGRSMTTGQLVTTDLRERLPASLELTFTALLIALVSAVPLGVLAALRPGSVVDHCVRLFCALGGISACGTSETIGSYGTIQGPTIAMSVNSKTPAAEIPVSGLPRRIQPAWRSAAPVIRSSLADRRCHREYPRPG